MTLSHDDSTIIVMRYAYLAMKPVHLCNNILTTTDTACVLQEILCNFSLTKYGYTNGSVDYYVCVVPNRQRLVC